jgi:tRNA pseudouridine32 synthase/23S rRNA pseudouridine746 synthase
MDTSGLLLFARSHEAQRILSMHFEKRNVVKTYAAIVEGILGEESGTVDLPMRKDMTQRLPPKHLIDCIRGKQAVTRWEVIQRNPDTTRVRLLPETGRSHQLRLHMQSIGHPVVGDPIYGTPAERLKLHADSLAFQHPSGGRSMQLFCPAPF